MTPFGLFALFGVPLSLLGICALAVLLGGGRHHAK